MKIRSPSILKPLVAVLGIAMLAVALACASDDPTPTSPPTVQPTPTTSAAATPLTVDGQPTAMPVSEAITDLPWIERYLLSPGYDPEWGEPVRGGTFIFGAQRDSTRFHPFEQACCYTHGCYAGLPMNSLFRIDAWTGDLTTVEGDLVESWEMSEDGKTLTMQLQQGVTFFDEESLAAQTTKTTVPAEFNGGQILGDELVCEDAKASMDRFRWPPVWENRITHGGAYLGHLESTSCPDGDRGYTFVMHFSEPRGKTLGILAGDAATIFDADFIAWLNDWGQREESSYMDTQVPENFYAQIGTGPFIPVDLNQSVHTMYNANPNYWREGLPIVDRYQNVVIKDIGSRFTALATGKIHYMGEGSWSMTPGQAQQAIRDFSDRVVINNQLNHWARTIVFGSKAPWNDVRMRKAIHLAIDRDGWLAFYRIPGYEGMKLAQTMAPGTYYAPTDEEIRTWPGYRQPKDEDIAEANRLMDEVMGAGNRPSAECMAVTTDQSDIDACLYLIDNLKKNLGMEIGSDFMEQAARDDIASTGNFDFTISSYVSATIGDPDDDLFNNYLLDLVAATSKNFMQARWDEQPEVMQEVADMINAQSAELDPVKRKEMVAELDQKLLSEVSQYVVVGWSLIFPGWRTELKGWKGYDLYSNTKYVMNERMWIAQ